MSETLVRRQLVARFALKPFQRAADIFICVLGNHFTWKMSTKGHAAPCFLSLFTGWQDQSATICNNAWMSQDYTYRVGQKTGLFLTSDNFAITNNGKVCNMSKVMSVQLNILCLICKGSSCWSSSGLTTCVRDRPCFTVFQIQIEQNSCVIVKSMQFWVLMVYANLAKNI